MFVSLNSELERNREEKKVRSVLHWRIIFAAARPSSSLFFIALKPRVE